MSKSKSRPGSGSILPPPPGGVKIAPPPTGAGKITPVGSPIHGPPPQQPVGNSSSDLLNIASGETNPFSQQGFVNFFFLNKLLN